MWLHCALADLSTLGASSQHSGILLGGRWKMYLTYYLFVTKALGRAAARQVMQASTIFCSL